VGILKLMWEMLPELNWEKLSELVPEVLSCQNTSQWRSTYCVTISSFNLHNSRESCCSPVNFLSSSARGHTHTHTHTYIYIYTHLPCKQPNLQPPNTHAHKHYNYSLVVTFIKSYIMTVSSVRSLGLKNIM